MDTDSRQFDSFKFRQTHEPQPKFLQPYEDGFRRRLTVLQAFSFKVNRDIHPHSCGLSGGFECILLTTIQAVTGVEILSLGQLDLISSYTLAGLYSTLKKKKTLASSFQTLRDGCE